MATLRPTPNFREWLSDAIPKSGLSKREIARRMATRHPRGVNHDTMETARRTLNKILAGELTPRNPMRDSIAAALDRDDQPSVEDEEEDDLAVTMMALARDPQTVRALSRILRTAQR